MVAEKRVSDGSSRHQALARSMGPNVMGALYHTPIYLVTKIKYPHLAKFCYTPDMRFSFSQAVSDSAPEEWSMPAGEGQLAVDVFRRDGQLVIRSTMAGVKPEDVDVAVNGDLLTIRGTRQHTEEVTEDDWFHRECYWGSFSRSVVLPVDVYAEQADASLRDGILEIRIPIRGMERQIKVK
jgi:HSP20 family protein